MKQAIFSLIIAMLIFTVGCDFSNFFKPQAEQTNKEIKGRKETVNLEAVGAVGYDGQAVRSAVDKVLEQNAERLRQLEKIK